MKNKTLKYIKSYYNRNCKNGQWESFLAFALSIGVPPKANMKLTRKCIKKGFIPGNLMWAKTVNYNSRYVVNTLAGNTASLKAACEQDAVHYPNVMYLVRNYDLAANPQAAYNYCKLDKNSRRTIKRHAIATAIKQYV